MKTKKLTKNILEYTVIFEPAEEGGYVVNVPTIPGCRTEGDTFEEAVARAKDAITGCLEVLKEEGLEIPTEEKETVITKIAVSSPIFAA